MKWTTIRRKYWSKFPYPLIEVCAFVYLLPNNVKKTTFTLCQEYSLDLVCVDPVQVLVIALLTALVQYPNPYTRFNASQVIRKLFSQCGPEDTGDLWSVASDCCVYAQDLINTDSGNFCEFILL